jgi:hypothetical protein
MNFYIKGICNVDNDLAIPLLEFPRNIFVRREWDGEEDHLSLISVLNGVGNDARAKFLRRRDKCLGSTRVCDCHFDILTCEGACERGTNSDTEDNVDRRADMR